MVYLDNAATTQVCREAIDAAAKQMHEGFGNPSSTHAAGRAARGTLESARAVIASSIFASPEEIFFTSGGTEGNNWALLSAAHLTRHKGKHIISSMTEHDSVRETLKYLSRLGWDVTMLPPSKDGAVHKEAVINALRPDTTLVSLMTVNNETGAVSDIPSISDAIRKTGSSALLHTDAVQGFMKLPIKTKHFGADMITISGHKVHAPKGIGALYIRKGLHLPPLLHGGGQESAMRSGTENVPGISAFSAAVSAYMNDPAANNRMISLRSAAVTRLERSIPGVIFLPGSAPHILGVSFPGYKSEVLLNYLDAKGVFVSKGSACKRGRRSHVLEAMGLPPATIDGTLRISFSRFTTEQDIDKLCSALQEAVTMVARTS